MDNPRSILVKTLFKTVLAASVAVFLVVPDGYSQSKSYELLPAPDIWYNSVDGIRVGARVLGQTPGSFGDGPHRLNAGVWLGTKFPEDPVSYYLSFAEPIPSISDFGSEANITLESSFRTGFQQHGLTFNKRWQTGFDEQNYKEFAIGFRAEHRFDKDYLLYKSLWQEEWLFLANLKLAITNLNSLGRYYVDVSGEFNVGGNYNQFIRSEISYQQKVNLNEYFSLSGRIYSGFASDQTAPEYLFFRSLNSPRSWMNSGLTRARGTIPPSWIKSGGIQVTGGPNLRGYVSQDIQTLNDISLPFINAPSYTSLSSLSLEFDYPNPLDNAIKKIPVLGGFIDLRSYLFYDAGTSLGLTTFEEDNVLSDAGLGFLFSINIPDYLGKPRGIMIRYDLPLWLSHPGNQKSFKFRDVLGIGAIISL